MDSHIRKLSKGHQSGFALITVLAAVAIVSALAIAFLAAGETQMKVSANQVRLAQLEAAADGGVELAAWRLMAAYAGTSPSPPTSGQTSRCSVGAITLEIAIQDEAGKVDLNVASPEMLQAVLGYAGLEPAAAAQLASRIAQRTTRQPDGTVSSVRLISIEELMRFPGVTPALLERLRPLVTVYSHSAAIDLSIAPAAVKQALSRMRDAPPAGLALSGQAFRVVVRAQSRAGLSYSRDAIIELNSGENSGFSIRAWGRRAGASPGKAAVVTDAPACETAFVSAIRQPQDE